MIKPEHTNVKKGMFWSAQATHTQEH